MWVNKKVQKIPWIIKDKKESEAGEEEKAERHVQNQWT